MIRLVSEYNVIAWLCGHRHHGYILEPTPERSFGVFCAGSATQANWWSYNIYTVHAGTIEIQRRVYAVEEDRYIDGERMEMRFGTRPDE